MGEEFTSSPTTVSGKDVGGDTGRRFRYQYAYGVVLLCAAQRRIPEQDYLAIYCEHYDDFLCERRDGKFDAYQIKTKLPADRGWTMKSTELISSITRFVGLDSRFPGMFESFYFTSNLMIEPAGEAAPAAKLAANPNDFLAAVRKCTAPNSLPPPFLETFHSLLQQIDAPAERIFKTLRRVRASNGPELGSIRATIIEEHITKIRGCAGGDSAQKRELYGRLYAQFERASTQDLDDPDRHLRDFIGGGLDSIRIQAKRIDCTQNIELPRPEPREADAGMEGVGRVGLRIAVLPLEQPRPRPANLLMTLGLDRRASIAVTVGVDAADLHRDLLAVEALVANAPLPQLEFRSWTHSDPPDWPAQDGGAGLIWSLAEAPSPTDLARALVMPFREPRAGCGAVLVIALPRGAETVASAIAQAIQARGAVAASASAADGIPIQAWSAERAESSLHEPLLSRLLECVEAGAAHDRNSVVNDAFDMRLCEAEAPIALWRQADSERLRLHDLSLLYSDHANRPNGLDEHRAAALIAEATKNRNLLYALSFLPVGPMVVRALARAPAATRAVAGLLTGPEMRALRPAFSLTEADGYRPAPAGIYRPRDWRRSK